jgi:hypothetical protein
MKCSCCMTGVWVCVRVDVLFVCKHINVHVCIYIYIYIYTRMFVCMHACMLYICMKEQGRRLRTSAW